MTVEFMPARPLFSGAPRKRLRLPGEFSMVRTLAALLACILVACATTSCDDHAADARVALTTRAARELAQTQPAAGQDAPPNTPQDTPQDAAMPAAASGSPPPNLADGANDAAALAARAVRSPARPGAADVDRAATDAANVPLVPPVIHTAD
ncbi:hypothetical protein [Paraburkholderia sp. J63]|uniref:hypothetical protein n=1 Tax=Paraburkholderia sp. J63 TaxID=2805434 RepID=UPI002ABD25B1|nr:hypothetical protein [Paraburkholderia sp. J63]